jgi:branched-chain amino acid transport system permease protein
MTASSQRRSGAAIAAPLLKLLPFVALVALGPHFLDYYTTSILITAFLYAVAAVTADVLWGRLGILSFAQVAFFAIGAYAMALVSGHLGISIGTALLAIFAGLVASALLAWLVALLSMTFGQTAMYGSVVTLVITVVVAQVALSGGSFTGSSSGLSGFPTVDWGIETWFWVTGFALIAVTAVIYAVCRSEFGMILTAIRDNETRSQYLGLNTSAIKIAVFVACAMLASLAGAGYASYTTVVTPELSGFAFGTQLIVCVALGSRGTIIGPVLATIAYELISAYLGGSLPFVWQLVVAIAFVLVVVLLPNGFAPYLKLPGRVRKSAARTVDLVVAPMRQRAAHAKQGAAILVENVAKSFGSLKVLKSVSFTAAPGETVGIIGPNGAGKSTLMRAVSDGRDRTGGTVTIMGRQTRRLAPAHVVELGVGRKFQTATLFDDFTVAECLILSRLRFGKVNLFGVREALALPETALRVITMTGLGNILDEQVTNLSHGQKQALELAMVLALEPSVILLDEPTAGLTKAERADIGTVFRQIAEVDGICLLLIEHDVDFVKQISSRLIVLHDGAVLMDGSVDAVVNSELVQSVYSGKKPAEAA